MLVQRVVDAWQSFPYLIIILSVMAVLGPGLGNVVISLAVLIAATNSRVIRGATLGVMQQAYVNAYSHLRQFDGRSKFSTWLTRIALHEALARKKRRGRYDELDAIEESKGDSDMILKSGRPDPEEDMAQSELRGLLENACLLFMPIQECKLVIG